MAPKHGHGLTAISLDDVPKHGLQVGFGFWKNNTFLALSKHPRAPVLGRLSFLGLKTPRILFAF